MTVILRDTSNRKFQFARKRPASRDPALPAFTTQQEALTFLNNLKSILTANDWFTIRTQVKLTAPKGVEAIRQQLATELASDTLHLIPAKSKMPASITVQSRNTARGSTGQNSTAQDQSPDVETDASSGADIEHPRAKKIPNDKEAVKQAQAGQVIASDDQDLGKTTSSDDQGPKKITGAANNPETTTCGCPISMVSGEEVLPIEDLILPGPLPFIWKRFYRTGHSRDSGLGHGWTHSGSEQLTLHDQAW